MLATKGCIVCKKNQVQLLYPSLNIVKCQNCGFIYRDAKIDPGYYVKFETYKEFLEDSAKLAFRKRNISHRFDFIEKVTTKKGKFLDIGTNEGFVLLEAKKRGFEAVGCEPNIYAAEYAKSLGFTVFDEYFEGCFENLKVIAPFEFISLFHVLEHVPDPNATLQMIKTILSKDGYLIIEVPDITSPSAKIYKWEELRIGKEHLSYFNKHSLGQLLENNGFKVVFCKRRSADEFNRSFCNNLIRLPLFMQAYIAARKVKAFLKKLFGSQPPPRKSLEDNRELWITGKMEDKRYFLSKLLGDRKSVV
ncbi:MAG: class I SAM-dependent methyltransferase, partial [Candidatus Omnitrophica bacterium]|nr:class I SAM-dependent methyltransferase [Candidatus Omnitrophota bacterium]